MGKKHQETGRVLANEQIAPGIFCLTAEAPQIAREARPGQFVHVRVSENPVQFLRMPFAVYDVDMQAGSVDVCYQVVGAGTEQLSGLGTGSYVDFIGPVGNGWTPPVDAQHALLIAGGVGAPAVNLLARQLSSAGVKVDAVMGAQTKGKFACVDRIQASCEASGGTVYLTTDDGSFGTHGFVTAESDGLIASGAYDYVAVCGPTPMMRNAVKPALERGVTCQVSMEKLMACGVGACLSCIVETVNGRKRCCVDGPVFDAAEVVW